MPSLRFQTHDQPGHRQGALSVTRCSYRRAEGGVTEFVPQDYSEEHLLQIGGQLAAGVPYEYNELRLGKLLAQGEAVGSVNGKALL